MTFNQINYFLAVARHLNFTRAAESLFVTQSTLSRSIAALETELGVTLLERNFHNVKLTPAGELISKEMQEIMGNIHDLMRRARALEGQENDRLVIGILQGQSVANSVLFAIRILSDNFPQFSVDIRKMGHEELIEAIRTKDIDVAETLLTPDTRLDEDLRYYCMEEAAHYLVAWQEDSIWKEEVSIFSLQDRVLIFPQKSNPAIDWVERHLREAGIKPRIKLAKNMETHSLWLDAGVGVSVCNEQHIICAAPSVRPLRAVPLKEIPPVSVSIMWSDDKPAPMLARFLGYIHRDGSEKKRVLDR